MRVGVLEFGVGFREFGLTVFDDGAESELVAGLRQFESQVRLLAQLLRYRKPLIRLAGIEPTVSDIPCDVVFEAAAG